MAGSGDRIRVFIAKASLDGHWRGVMVVTAALRDAGMEVIYGGMLTPQQIVTAALQEDADVVGLNVGGRYGTVQEVVRLLRERGRRDVVVVVGGTTPREDISLLKGMGVDEVFPPGSDLDEIVRYIKGEVGRRRTSV